MKRSAAHRNSIRPGERPTGAVIDSPDNASPADPLLAGFGRFIARSRYVVLIAVVAVLLVSLTLFLLGALNAFAVTWKVWREAYMHGEFASTNLLIDILGVIDVMLRAVIFYIIGVGLYSLFIAPLNLTAALGVESLIDLDKLRKLLRDAEQDAERRTKRIRTGMGGSTRPAGGRSGKKTIRRSRKPGRAFKIERRTGRPPKRGGNFTRESSIPHLPVNETSDKPGDRTAGSQIDPNDAAHRNTSAACDDYSHRGRLDEAQPPQIPGLFDESGQLIRAGEAGLRLLRKTLPGNSSRFAPRTPTALPIVAKDLLLFPEVSYHFPATTGTENRNIATFGVSCFGRPPARRFRRRWFAMMVKRLVGV